MNKSFGLFFLVAFLSSCGIKKTVTSTSPSVLLKTTSEIISEVNSNRHYPIWLSLYGKATITQNDKNITATIRIKNRKDSVIWISAIGPFGIEIIRAQLTPDSIYFANRINKTYWKKPTSKLRDFVKSEISFYDVQDLITSNLKIIKSNYMLNINEFGYYLNSDSASYFINSNYIAQHAKLIDNTKTIELKQELYHKTDGFPRKITLEVHSDQYFKAVINYSKVVFNNAEKIIFEIPDSYNEIK